jgi:hypothetical protein
VNRRAKDINLLKIALLPAVILTTVAGTLSLLATHISTSAAVDTQLPATQGSITDAPMTAHQSASRTVAKRFITPTVTAPKRNS